MTRFGTVYEPGDIAIVPFSYTDLSSVKRPTIKKTPTTLTSILQMQL